MHRRPMIHYTETDKALMWDRWQKGESLQSIAQLFGRNHSSVATVLSRTGGIRAPRSRAFEVSPDVSRKGRDISRFGSWPIDSDDCIVIGTCSLYS